GLQARRMSAAFQVAFAQPDLLQPRAHRLDVAPLAVVRGASERNVLVAEPKPLDSAAFHESHRLDRLVGRARQDVGVDVAPRGHHGAVRLHHCGDPFVAAFDHRAARDFDDDRSLAHGMRSNLMTVTLSWCGLPTASTAEIRVCTGLADCAAMSMSPRLWTPSLHSNRRASAGSRRAPSS